VAIQRWSIKWVIKETKRRRRTAIFVLALGWFAVLITTALGAWATSNRAWFGGVLNFGLSVYNLQVVTRIGEDISDMTGAIHRWEERRRIWGDLDD
jgi:uncharacterized membrane protein YadS